MNSLSSKTGYNQFSIFKEGVVSQYPKTEWIKGAFSDIITKMDIFTTDFTSKSITDQFLDNFESYNFEEFFSNETLPEGGADPPTVDEDVKNFDLSGNIRMYERFIDILTRYVELQSAKSGYKDYGSEDCEYIAGYSKASYLHDYFYDGSEFSLGKAF